MTAKILLKKKSSKKRMEKLQTKRAFASLMKMYKVWDGPPLTTKAGQDALMDKFNKAQKKNGRGPYLLVAGPNVKPHLRPKKANKKMSKQKKYV